MGNADSGGPDGVSEGNEDFVNRTREYSFMWNFGLAICCVLLMLEVMVEETNITEIKLP